MKQDDVNKLQAREYASRVLNNADTNFHHSLGGTISGLEYSSI